MIHPHLRAEMEKQIVYSIADVGKTDSDSLKTVKPEAKAKMVVVVEKLADDINGKFAFLIFKICFQ